jgi:type II secretory pathway pseudopilin PulG
MTLPELLVGMVLAGIVTSLVLVAVIAMNRGDRYTQQDSEALGALRTGMDRFEKEIRQARKLYSDSNSTRVHFWVDYNRDNQQDLVEKVVWRVKEVAGGAELIRTTDAPGATEQIIARAYVLGAGFGYNVQPDANGNIDNGTATLVTATFVADSRVGQLAPERTMRTAVRLRNAEKGI